MKTLVSVSKKLLAVAAAVIGFAAFSADAPVPLATGDKVSQLPLRNWIHREKLLPENHPGKIFVLLFWNRSQQSSRIVVNAAKLAERYQPRGILFVGVLCENRDAVPSETTIRDLPFPVAVDDKLEAVGAFLRADDRVPVCAILDQGSRLAWRGPMEKVSAVLDRMLDGKFDLADEIRREKVYEKLAAAIKIRDVDTMLKLSEEELKIHPDDTQMVTLNINLLAGNLKKPDAAFATIEKALAASPANPMFYELGIKVLHSSGDSKKLNGFYRRLAADFADRPLILMRFADLEMRQSERDTRPENVVLLARAAETAKFRDKREEGLTLLACANAYYYCGRPDLAFESAKKALPLLKDFPEAEKARNSLGYFNRILQVSRSL